MNTRTKTIVATGLVIGALLGTSACSSDADVASKNISNAADNFEVERQIVFYNGITDKYIAEVNGLCSVEKNVEKQQFEVTCKVGKNQFIKNYLGLSDNVTYFSLQTTPNNVNTSRYTVNFKPESVVPNVRVN